MKDQLTEHFHINEFRCKCGCSKALMNQDLADKLEQIRIAYGKPMKVLSGYRCKYHNQKVGGVDNSYHTQGLAVDIQYDSSNDIYNLVRIALQMGINRIGIYKSGFVHFDIGTSPKEVIWLG